MTINDFLNYWEYFLLIDKDLMNTNRYICHSDNNLNAYSSEFARIILVTCAEIDTVCRLLCKEIDSSCDFPDDSTRSGDIKEYCRIILTRFPKLPSTEVYFTTIKQNMKPWDGWQTSPNYQSPVWWNDYQFIKHYRHTNFEKAKLKNAFQAVASLFVLLMYLHKTVFHYTRSVETDDPICFYSPCMMDFDSNLGEKYDVKQLPDY